MSHGLFQVTGFVIDLERLKAEREGKLPVPPERHATEAARNDAAVRDKFFNIQVENGPAYEPSVGDYTQIAHSWEEHLKSKGYTQGAISEHLLDLAKHQDEKNRPGPDLTYFSEWENAVGLHHSQPRALTIDEKAERAGLIRKEAIEPRTTEEPERPTGFSFAISTRVRFREDDLSNRVGLITSTPIQSRDGRGIIQAVKWNNGNHLWELVAELDAIEPRTTGPNEYVIDTLAELHTVVYKPGDRVFTRSNRWWYEYRYDRTWLPIGQLPGTAPRLSEPTYVTNLEAQAVRKQISQTIPVDPFLAHHHPDCACSGCEARRAKPTIGPTGIPTVDMLLALKE